MPEIITTQPNWTTAPDAATYKTDLDTAILELDVVAATRTAVAHAIGGVSYQTLLGLPCPPSLEWAAYDSVELPSGYPSWLTFTRASSATRVGPTGLIESVASGVLRHDYDPETLEYKGVLIEGGVSNLLLRSQEFANGVWLNDNCEETDNQVVAPDGTTTGAKLKLTAATPAADSDNSRQNVTVADNSNTYTASCFFKAGSLSTVGLRLIFTGGTGVSAQVDADLAAGTITTGLGTPTQSSIQRYGNGWYRVSVSVANNSTGNTTSRVMIFPGVSESPAQNSYVYAWGAQLEAGASPASYIPTTTATVTRATDVLSVPTSNFPFNASEGTLYVACVFASAANSYSVAVSLEKSGSAATERAIIFKAEAGSADVKFRMDSSGSGQMVEKLGVMSPGSTIYGAFAYKTDDVAACINGGTVYTDTSATLPTVDMIRIGRNGASTPLNGHVLQVAYFPRRITNTQLQRLTS